MTDLDTATERAPLPVEVDFRWTNPGGSETRSCMGFDSVEQARAFRDDLNAAIGAADPRGADRPADFAESLDAQEWARAFLERFDLELIGGETVDEGLLISWFANAIERGRDAGAKAWPEHPQLAETVRVVREGVGRARVEVDGQPFPWALGWPATIEVDGRNQPGVSLRLLAERVELVDTIKAGGVE